MPKAKMLKTTKGSIDGQEPLTFKEGETYDLTERLYDVFVNELKVAKTVKASKPKATGKKAEQKAKELDNKAIEAAPTNKSEG